MGLDFSKTTAAPTASAAVAPAPKNEIVEVQPYDIVADRQQMNAELVNSEEVDKLVSTIEIDNPATIVNFGAQAAEEISKTSDMVLNSVNLSQLDDSSELLQTLTKIMSQFDIDEIKEKPGLFGKLFGNAKKQLDKKLNAMFETNVNDYHELVKYILAGEQGCHEIETYIAKRQADMEQTGDQTIQFELTNLNQVLNMLEQRTQDLRVAENVAMQSLPMLKTMEFSNYNLIRKINSAFIVTLPVFKQALAQAVLLKRQKIQAEAISELDKKTNEMLMKNAQNSVEVSKMTARMASGSSIQIETLENTWKTITNGIEETRNIQAEAKKKRIEDQARLEAIKADFQKQYHMPSATR